MKRLWILAGLLLAFHVLGTRAGSAADEEAPKPEQRTGVLMSSSSSSGAEAARDVLVKTPPYQAPAPSPQAPAVSNKPEPAAAKPVTGTGSKKSAPSSSVKTQTSVAPKEHEPLTVAKPKVPVTPKKTALPPKPTEKSSAASWQKDACRVGGYIEENMSPEECRRQGGMMVAAAGASAGPKNSGAPSGKTEKTSLFDLRNPVCRVLGHEVKGLSAEECKKQGGVMITTWDVPTYHKPPANGKFLGEG